MSREIKFAFWNERKKELWSVLSIDCITMEVRTENEDVASLYDGILLQYTGLKDKNGTKIYQGDIIDVRNVGLCEVVFENGAFFIFKKPSFMGLLYQYTLDGAVVGNIYDRHLE